MASQDISSNAVYDGAFQGSWGAFSEVAAWEFLTPAARLLPCTGIADVFDAVQSGKARYGVVPVENSLAGSIHVSFDMLHQHELFIIAETVCHIEHALVGAPGVRLEDVRKVLSLPVALAQCEQFFRSHPEFQAVPEYDTAGAVEKVVRENLRDSAAIAGRRTAEIFGGVVLADRIQDYPENYTRFLLISPENRAPAGAGRRKTTILFKLANAPGALFNALRPFAERGIDLAKIESRPIKGSSFEYLFYVDLVSEPGAAPAVESAIGELSALCVSLRVLGAYPQARHGLHG